MVRRDAILDKNALLRPMHVRTTPVQTLTEQSCLLVSQIAVETQWATANVNVVRRFAILEKPALFRPIRVRTPLARMLTEQNRSLDSQIAVGLQ